jgi:hypothetical protein
VTSGNGLGWGALALLDRLRAGDGCFGAGVHLGLAPLPRGGVGIADRLVDRMHRVAGLDPLQPGGGLGAQRLGLGGVVGDVFEVADLLQRRVRRAAGNHRRRLLACLARAALDGPANFAGPSFPGWFSLLNWVADSCGGRRLRP